jgi:hypothetical protein
MEFIVSNENMPESEEAQATLPAAFTYHDNEKLKSLGFWTVEELLKAYESLNKLNGTYLNALSASMDSIQQLQLANAQAVQWAQATLKEAAKLRAQLSALRLQALKSER